MSYELEINPTVTESEAIALAVQALEEAADKFHFDLRAAKMMGDAIPREAKERVILQAKYVEAKKVLQGLKWWQGKPAEARG